MSSIAAGLGGLLNVSIGELSTYPTVCRVNRGLTLRGKCRAVTGTAYCPRRRRSEARPIVARNAWPRTPLHRDRAAAGRAGKAWRSSNPRMLPFAIACRHRGVCLPAFCAFVELPLRQHETHRRRGAARRAGGQFPFQSPLSKRTARLRTAGKNCMRTFDGWSSRAVFDSAANRMGAVRPLIVADYADRRSPSSNKSR